MIFLGASLLALLAIGVPVGFALAGTATLYSVLVLDIPFETVSQRLFGGVDSFLLMAIPFFILAGELMNESGITERLVRFVRLTLGWMYGSLAQVNVAASMLFGGMTGVAAADTAALGSVLIPAMVEDEYEPEFATAVTVASGLVGPIIPPSVPMLVYGVASGASIGALFLAGAIPGIVLGLSLLVLNYVLLKRKGFHAQREVVRPSLRDLLVGTKDALLALLMPVIILGGILLGVVTPTEAAAVSVAYAFFVGAVVYRSFDWSRMPLVLVRAAVGSAMVLFIVTAASFVGWVLGYDRVPDRVGELLVNLTGSRVTFLLLTALLLLIVGLFMEPSGSLIILTPVLLPAAVEFGIDPVHFGAVMVLGLVIGLATPPVGITLFIGAGIARVSVERLSRTMLPFVLVLIAVLLLIAFVPALSLWLPNLLVH